MNLADELAKLHDLHERGILSEADYATAKARLLNGNGPDDPPAGREQQTRLWAMLLHFSQLLGYAVPLAGLVVPILIWQLKKAELPELDVHAKIVLNWLLSALIYAVGCMVLLVVGIGALLLLVLAALAIIFPIVGGIKANNGEAWRYPLSIRFFS